MYHFRLDPSQIFTSNTRRCPPPHQILKDAVAKTGRDIPNLTLNNIATVQDAVDFFLSKKEPKKGGVVKEFFEENENEIPSNVRFLPSVKEQRLAMLREKNPALRPKNLA